MYTLKEYADIFKSENNIGSEELCSDETVQTFMDFLSIDEKQCNIICTKTVQQANSQFWFDQRSGRIKASNFYKVCHMRETTDKTNTVKLLMNYCPLEHIPEQLGGGGGGGHVKEISASEVYFKKLSSKHQELTVVE